MIDIIGVGTDLSIYDTETSRAANLLSVQFGALEYAPTLGIDLKYFLSENFSFQNESFKAYLVQVLANRGINVSSVTETLDQLFSTFTFEIVPDQTDSSLIAR